MLTTSVVLLGVAFASDVFGLVPRGVELDAVLGGDNDILSWTFRTASGNMSISLWQDNLRILQV